MDFLVESKNSLNQFWNVEKKKHLLKKCLVRYFYFQRPKSAAEIKLSIKYGIANITTGIKELISVDVFIEQSRYNSYLKRQAKLFGLQNNAFLFFGN